MPNLPNSVAPPAVRGAAYTTPMYARCPNYHRCCRCLQCAHYNRHNALCCACEGVQPQKMTCACSDERQLAVITMEEIIGQPIWSPGGTAGSVTVQSTAHEGSAGQRIANTLAGGIQQSG